eukprot:13176570-Ditylum_brightwellii.AAC.1
MAGEIGFPSSSPPVKEDRSSEIGTLSVLLVVSREDSTKDAAASASLSMRERVEEYDITRGECLCLAQELMLVVVGVTAKADKALFS